MVLYEKVGDCEDVSILSRAPAVTSHVSASDPGLPKRVRVITSVRQRRKDVSDQTPTDGLLSSCHPVSYQLNVAHGGLAADSGITIFKLVIPRCECSGIQHGRPAAWQRSPPDHKRAQGCTPVAPYCPRARSLLRYVHDAMHLNPPPLPHPARLPPPNVVQETPDLTPSDTLRQRPNQKSSTTTNQRLLIPTRFKEHMPISRSKRRELASGSLSRLSLPGLPG